MKILFIGVFTENSTNVWQTRGFEELGWTVIRFDYRKIAEEIGIKERDKMLVEICKKEIPTITLFAKCNIMDVKVLEQCYWSTESIVLWMPDGIGSVDDELISKIKISNHVFCASPEVIVKVKKYCKSIHKLHGGYDSNVHRPINVLQTRDVCFIGKVHGYCVPYRQELWQETKFEIVNGVYAANHSKVVSETKINLALSDGNGMSNRIFKLLAAKGFVLANPWLEMDNDFTPGKDFDVFHSADELKSKIQFYLENKNKREEIAEYGYQTVQQYNELSFAKKIIEVVYE